MKIEILQDLQNVPPQTVQSAISFQQAQGQRYNENQSPSIKNDLSQFMITNQPMLLGEYQYGGDDDDPEDSDS